MSAATTAILSPSSFPGEREWHLSVLRRVTELVGSYKSGIRVFTGAGHRWTEHGFETVAIPIYNAYFQKFDHGRALGESGAYDSQVVSTMQRFKGRLPELRRSEFYCDFLKPFGFFDSISLSTRRRAHGKGSTLYLWHERELTEAERSRAIALLQLLAPAFRAGMGASVRLRCGNDSFFSVLDTLTDGCALFTPSGVLLHQNPALTAMQAQDEERELLRNAMSGVVAGVREASLWKSAGSADTRGPSADECTVSGTYRLSGCVLERSASGNAAAILVAVAFTPRASTVTHPRELRERFGLTQREWQVAQLLASRRTNQEIATVLGLSVHTARHHTESVMLKTGAASRTQVTTILTRR
jgi:DNA-binding CsgD family transcriptional regulator